MTEEDKKRIISAIEWDYYPKQPLGGQQAGLPIITWILKHPAYKIEIECGDFRSSTQNRQMCLTLFELFLMDR